MALDICNSFGEEALMFGRGSYPNSVCYNVVVSQHANIPNRMVYGYLVVIPFGKGSHITTVTTTNQTAKRYLSSLHLVHIPPHFVLNPHNAIILGHQVLH